MHAHTERIQSLVPFTSLTLFSGLSPQSPLVLDASVTMCLQGQCSQLGVVISLHPLACCKFSTMSGAHFFWNPRREKPRCNVFDWWLSEKLKEFSFTAILLVTVKGPSSPEDGVSLLSVDVLLLHEEPQRVGKPAEVAQPESCSHRRGCKNWGRRRRHCDLGPSCRFAWSLHFIHSEIFADCLLYGTHIYACACP